MNDCYDGDVTFYDPVFENLDGEQVRAMWEMLLGRAKDLRLHFSDIVTEPGYGSCTWRAEYTFTATGRKVVNKAKARFTMHAGKIVEHQDAFNLWNWSRQALGWPGLLFGWTSLLQKKIRKNARRSLDKFMTAQ